MGESNRRCASNMVCLLLVPQWHQSTIKSMTHYLKADIEYLYNGRRTNLSVSPISVTVALSGDQIDDARPYNTS
jgi:hypothetical protein